MSPSGEGETGYTAQEDMKSINSYNINYISTLLSRNVITLQHGMIKVWFFHRCIPRPFLVLSALLSLDYHK